MWKFPWSWVFIKDSASQLPQTEYNINNKIYNMEKYEIQIKQYLNYFEF